MGPIYRYPGQIQPGRHIVESVRHKEWKEEVLDRAMLTLALVGSFSLVKRRTLTRKYIRKVDLISHPQNNRYSGEVLL